MNFHQLKEVFLYTIDKISKRYKLLFLLLLEINESSLEVYGLFSQSRYIYLIKSNQINYILFRDSLILLSHFVDFDKYLSNEEKLLYLIEKILNFKAKEELLIKYGKKFDTSEFDNIKKKT